MTKISSRLYKLAIPFNLTFSHSEASRSVCDSRIVELGAGSHRGYGEIILRSYVNDPQGKLGTEDRINRRVAEILGELTGKGVPSLESLRTFLLDNPWEKPDLPLLAGIETALLDLLCRRNGTDIYGLLGRRPLRKEIRYGGILPILSPGTMEKILRSYGKLGITYLRIKLSGDYGYNDRTLALAREILGTDFDIRVDVNCGWNLESALGHLDLLRSRGVTLVEEPLGADPEPMGILAEKSRGSGVSYVADESAVLFGDVERIIGDGTFSMLNLRLAKNGGLLRVLELAERAEKGGLTYQLGSHVGETGILSVAGRIAASLMASPRYADGSFDDYILSGNITRRSYTFGPGGLAPVIEGDYMGYDVDREKLGDGVDLSL